MYDDNQQLPRLYSQMYQTPSPQATQATRLTTTGTEDGSRAHRRLIKVKKKSAAGDRPEGQPEKDVWYGATSHSPVVRHAFATSPDICE